jgi:CPA2 family monovalent cation:H+ antiporter-2
VPGRHNKLLPFDQIGIISTDEQMQNFQPVFTAEESITNPEVHLNDISFQHILVDEHSKLKGTTIRSSGLREKTNGLVIGIERKGERILNPGSNTVFEWDDIVWIVGERKKIHLLSQGKI